MKYFVVLLVFVCGCAHCSTQVSVSYHKDDMTASVTVTR